MRALYKEEGIMLHVLKDEDLKKFCELNGVLPEGSLYEWGEELKLFHYQKPPVFKLEPKKYLLPWNEELTVEDPAVEVKAKGNTIELKGKVEGLTLLPFGPPVEAREGRFEVSGKHPKAYLCSDVNCKVLNIGRMKVKNDTVIGKLLHVSTFESPSSLLDAFMKHGLIGITTVEGAMIFDETYRPIALRGTEGALGVDLVREHVVLSYPNKVEIWKLNVNDGIYLEKVGELDAWGSRVLACGNYAVVYSSDVFLIDVRSLKVVRVGEGAVSEQASCAEDKAFIPGERGLLILDLNDLKMNEIELGRINSVSTCGRKLVVAIGDKTLIMDVHSLKPVKELPPSEVVTFHPNCEALALGRGTTLEVRYPNNVVEVEFDDMIEELLWGGELVVATRGGKLTTFLG